MVISRAKIQAINARKLVLQAGALACYQILERINKELAELEKLLKGGV